MDKDKMATADSFGATVSKGGIVKDELKFKGVFVNECVAPVEEHRRAFVILRDTLQGVEAEIIRKTVELRKMRKSLFSRILKYFYIKDLTRELHDLKQMAANTFFELLRIPTYVKWTDSYPNLITTVGKNNMLDNHFSGSAYTAAWYMGLIDNASFSAVNAADTMGSHAGWIESTAYSQANRITTAWSAAAAGVKSLSAALGFSMNATATINGGFITSVSTKGGTTGVLNSAGSYTGGNRAVINGDTINASYSATLT